MFIYYDASGTASIVSGRRGLGIRELHRAYTSPAMLDVILVGIGGSVGAMARYLLSRYVQALAGPAFPFGTMAVNLLGCLVIGVLSQLADARNVFTPQSRAFVFAGILGGFTTFSSFAYETTMLAQTDQHLLALLNVILQVGLGLAAVWLGRALTGLIIK